MLEDWFGGLMSVYTDSSSLCTTWQQTFVEDMAGRVEKWGSDVKISQKQLVQLNKIADIYGYPLLKL
jgi:hypothetical protein